jgi:hypothetical protein
VKYLVYEYGCLPPVRGSEAAIDQMQRRNRLWNALVEVEHHHRSECLQVVSEDPPQKDVAQAAEQLLRLRGEIQKRRKAVRKRNVDISDLQAGVAMASAVLARAPKPAVRPYSRLTPQQKQQMEVLEVARRSAVKEAQAEAGLYWCNYDDVINSYERSRRRVRSTGGELRFHRWDGSGAVTVRFQYGLTVESAFGTDTRLQIEPVDPLAWSSPVRAIRRRLARSNVRIRIGTERRAPIWLELPVVLHRPMAEGVICSASVIREQIGGRERWRLLITVDRSEPEARSGPAVAIDLGWRKVPGGLRVAYWEDEHGQHGELVLHPDLLWEFSKLTELRSVKDRLFNQVRKTIADWAAGRDLPDWLDLTRIGQWRAYNRLLRLHQTWSLHRIPGDTQVFDALEEWRRRHLHVEAWEDNLRDQTAHHRREIYRRFVARLLRSHGSIFLEDFDLRQFARRAAPEGAHGAFIARARRIAAPSLLRKLLEEKGNCFRVDPFLTTRQCSWCDHNEPWNAAPAVGHSCEGCGRWFDQDRNAARNILRRGMVTIPRPGDDTGAAHPGPAPFSNSHAHARGIHAESSAANNDVHEVP